MGKILSSCDQKGWQVVIEGGNYVFLFLGRWRRGVLRGGPSAILRRRFMIKEDLRVLRVVLLMDVAMDCKEMPCLGVCEYFQFILYRIMYNIMASIE